MGAAQAGRRPGHGGPRGDRHVGGAGGGDVGWDSVGWRRSVWICWSRVEPSLAGRRRGWNLHRSSTATETNRYPTPRSDPANTNVYVGNIAPDWQEGDINAHFASGCTALWETRECMHACLRACVPACMHACMRACGASLLPATSTLPPLHHPPPLITPTPHPLHHTPQASAPSLRSSSTRRAATALCATRATGTRSAR